MIRIVSFVQTKKSRNNVLVNYNFNIYIGDHGAHDLCGHFPNCCDKRSCFCAYILCIHFYVNTSHKITIDYFCHTSCMNVMFAQ